MSGPRELELDLLLRRRSRRCEIDAVDAADALELARAASRAIAVLVPRRARAFGTSAT